MQLTNYYTMTVCTPARASIMTGRYPVRYGMQHATIKPGSPWGLPLDEKVSDLQAESNETVRISQCVHGGRLGSPFWSGSYCSPLSIACSLRGSVFPAH